MSNVGRRGFVIGASTLLLAGCTPLASSPTPSAPGSSFGPTTKPTSPPSTGTPTSAPTSTPTTDWASLRTSVKGKLYTVGQSGYTTAKRTENPRYDGAKPQAVLQVSNAADVVAALAFSQKSGVPLALKAGGHNYAGWSSGGTPPALVLSTSNLTSIDISADGTSVKVGSGATLVTVYNALGKRGRAIGGGSCATVGVTGLTLGGGVGVLTRSFGLACDQLTEIDIITADGVMHHASPTVDPDLFWACQGGGGGELGVVTSLTFTTQPAPQVTQFFISFPFSAAAQVVSNWQSWIANADDKLWSTLKMLGGVTKHPNGPSVGVSGTWTGPASQLTAQLAPLLSGLPNPLVKGVKTRSYGDAMMDYAGCLGLPISECNTGPTGKLVRESATGTSSIGYVPLTSAGIATAIKQVQAAQSVSGIREGGISMDALGGKVADVAADATAFPHRAALMTVQYTGTFNDGQNPANIEKYVRGFRTAMIPYWGDHAYVNYADPSLKNAQQAYFGDNLPKLQAIKKKYDPTGFFKQPESF